MAMMLAGMSITALAQNKPSLATELGTAIEQGGAAALKKRFSEIWPAQKADYEIDIQAMMMLSAEYISAGDRDVIEQLGEINTVLTQDMMQNARAASGLGVAEQIEQERALRQGARDAEARSAQVEKEQQAARQAASRGKARQDLDRFVGLYGKEPRQLFVTRSCDGYLVAGALWADTTPWWMRSAADTVFSYEDNFTSLAIEFKTNDEGDVERLSHDLEGLASPLSRTGELPSELFSECLARPKR